MNCYDCARAGATATAVGVCSDCGAGVCADCVRVEHTNHAHVASPGTSAARRTRTLTCPSCDAVLGRAHASALSVGEL